MAVCKHTSSSPFINDTDCSSTWFGARMRLSCSPVACWDIIRCHCGLVFVLYKLARQHVDAVGRPPHVQVTTLRRMQAVSLSALLKWVLLSGRTDSSSFETLCSAAPSYILSSAREFGCSPLFWCAVMNLAM